ncbi:TnsA-like heteromeric transposase endonuclease subunit [Paeniglutamicibacter sp. Y32M11]|uniref:TnsA-like heteromeric transposase endonuclease subunit n=1 Tax=Paeniglutamicibacter sp. Y32M11 TaxID=2853258 RepID=UPI001C52C7DB|nr:TnsA-like heteromeric transposase endonuclease subunit [Paeniglutamicibacter sp. Y32M11]QXQ08766.1 TnsA-like heteromeric transposase endonuclease subunit [Paeniglutamicibacter sp. Y32M11]
MGHQQALSEIAAEQSVVEGTLSYRAQFSYAATTGVLSASWMIPFEDALPIRRLSAFKGQRNFVGLWWCATNLRHVGFESWCERDRLMRLDFEPEVTGVASQPFRISLPASAPQDSHVPDFFVRNADGTAVVIDVRPDTLVTEADLAVFEATAALCASVGWGYQRVGYLAVIHAANLRWIAGYRHPRCYREDVGTEVLAYLESKGPHQIRSLVASLGDPVCVVPTVFHLIWQHRIAADLLTTPLCLESVIEVHEKP